MKLNDKMFENLLTMTAGEYLKKKGNGYAGLKMRHDALQIIIHNIRFQIDAIITNMGDKKHEKN